MGTFDQIYNDDPRLPFGAGATLQAYLDIGDSYGDFYRIDTDGQLWRLTQSACMNPSYGVLDTPLALDYTDPKLAVYVENDAIDAYLLTFEHGKLISWHVNELA